MPGSSSDNRVIQVVGLAFFVVAVVGTAVYGWEFGGDSGTVPTALALVAVGVAVAVTLRRRL